MMEKLKNLDSVVESYEAATEEANFENLRKTLAQSESYFLIGAVVRNGQLYPVTFGGGRLDFNVYKAVAELTPETVHGLLDRVANKVAN